MTDSDPKAASFLVPRLFFGAPFQLLKARSQQLEMFQSWYGTMTPFNQVVALGLFAATNGRPDQVQEIAASDLLEIVEVSRYATASGQEAFSGQHFNDAFAALVDLYNRSIPWPRKIKRVKGEKEERIDIIRMIDLLRLIYVHPSTRQRIAGDDPMFEDDRIDISDRTRRKKTGTESDLSTLAKHIPKPVFALVKSVESGKPILHQPIGYGFRWSREIAGDILGTPDGAGFLQVQKKIFGTLKLIRHANNGRGNQTAGRIFSLVVGDIVGNDTRVVNRAAVQVFKMLGFTEPKRRHADNVVQVAAAVRLLKELGVLLPSSDEEPVTDPNPDRRKAPYYRWRRSPDWNFSGPKAEVDQVGRKGWAGINPELVPSTEPTDGIHLSGTITRTVDFAAQIQRPEHCEEGEVDGVMTIRINSIRPGAKPNDSRIQRDLFGQIKRPAPTGRQVREAREKAGLSLRQFAKLIGSGSIKTWSDIETEKVAARTGKPKAIPPSVVDRVAAFVAEQLRTEGNKE